MSDPTDLYALLGVPHTASAADLKRAYRAGSKTRHPDAGGDPEAWKLFAAAYELLSDPDQRARYDAADGDLAHMVAVEQLAYNCINEALQKAFDPIWITESSSTWSYSSTRRQTPQPDPLGAIRAKIESDLLAIATVRPAHHARIAELEARRARIHRAGDGPNILADMITAQIAPLRAQLQLAERTATACRRALELLKCYRIDAPDSPPPGYDAAAGARTSATTT